MLDCGAVVGYAAGTIGELGEAPLNSLRTDK